MSDPAAELWLARLDVLSEPLAALEADDALAPAGDLDGLDASRRVARLLLRRLVARLFGRGVAAQPFVTGAHGKPSLPGLGGDFNLSHTMSGSDGPVALIGLGRVRSIGVDLEPVRAVRIDARRRAMIIAAAENVADGAPLPDDAEARIVQAWARLEAWGKADGRGIGRTLTHFGVLGAAARSLEPEAAGLAARGDLTVTDVDAGPSLFASVALPRGESVPPVRHLRDATELATALAGGEAVGKSGVDLAAGAGQKGPHRSVAQPG